MNRLALALLILLAACATHPPPSTTAPEAEMPKSKTEAAKTLGKTKAVDIKADCLWKDENGYNGQMKLVVDDNTVSAFDAVVTHPKHGSCRFAFADFQQVKKTPHVELKAAKSACTVRMWAQGRQVSVAFSKCQAMCTGDVTDYLWPILADSKTGSCG